MYSDKFTITILYYIYPLQMPKLFLTRFVLQEYRKELLELRAEIKIN